MVSPIFLFVPSSSIADTTAAKSVPDMLLVKVARLKNRKTEDCYIDMAGYAAIAGEIHEQEDDADSPFSTAE